MEPLPPFLFLSLCIPLLSELVLETLSYTSAVVSGRFSSFLSQTREALAWPVVVSVTLTGVPPMEYLSLWGTFICRSQNHSSNTCSQIQSLTGPHSSFYFSLRILILL